MLPLRIPMQLVTSSQIHSVGHDDGSKTLAIRFKAKTGLGSLYHYSGVQQSIFKEMLSADSVGKFFGAHIKGNSNYPFLKIDESQQPESA